MPTGAAAAADDFRRKVEQLSIPVPATADLRFTVSAGVAALCDADADFAALLKRADEALYEAKGAGRNCVMAAREAAPPSVRVARA